MIIHYRLVGHGRWHFIIGGEVLGVLHYGRQGAMQRDAWIAKLYGPLNQHFETGRTKYHAIKNLYNVFLRGYPHWKC